MDYHGHTGELNINLIMSFFEEVKSKGTSYCECEGIQSVDFAHNCIICFYNQLLIFSLLLGERRDYCTIHVVVD